MHRQELAGTRVDDHQTLSSSEMLARQGLAPEEVMVAMVAGNTT